ncbi:DNA internalization-related competence protein ComEC/Rec2 [Pullulanibacillus pueri]|nr:DNA internalization-related competence protein ComEC/Rec2 [Pullulanibacillus pueri]
MAILAIDHSSRLIWFLLALGGIFIYLLSKHRGFALAFLAVFLFFTLDSVLQDHPTRLVAGSMNQRVQLDDRVLIDGDTMRTTVLLDGKERVQVTYKMKSKEDKQFLDAHLKIAQVCHFYGTLKRPDPVSNFDAFDYRQYLKHQGIYWEWELASYDQCYDPPSLTVFERLKRGRQKGIRFVSSHFPKPWANMVNALVFADKDDINPDLLDAYQNLGLIHLLAVSGLHVGVLIGLLYFCLLRLGFVKQHVHLFLLLVVLPAYVLLTGCTPSVIRAALMAAFLLSAPLSKIKLSPLTSLALACLFTLVFQPHTLYSVGFQLSYLITFALIVSVETMRHRSYSSIMQIFITTGIAEVIALPILLYNFYTVSLLSFLLNLIYIPLISLIILPGAWLTLCLTLSVPSIGSLINRGLNIVVRYMNEVLTLLNTFPSLTLSIGKPSIVGMTLLILGILAVFILWEKVNHWAIAFIFISFVLGIALIHWLSMEISPRGSVTFIDVGQGDAALIVLPHHQGVYLIDTGGSLPYPKAQWQKKKREYNVGREVILPQLKALGIHELTAVMITHRDFDHMEGIRGLIGNIPIKSLMVSNFFTPTKTERDWLKSLRNSGTHLIRVKAGEQWSVGQSHFQVLWPETKGKDTNDQSLVLRVNMGSLNWLFTGDLDQEGERGLLSQWQDIDADILKVGHHGSKTSSSEAFLKAVSPKLAIISVGKNNHYGHPSNEVIKRLEEQNIKTLRTDQKGAIRIEFTSQKVLSIKTVKP